MRAMVFEEYGGPEKLIIQDHPVPEPGNGEVRVEVKAFGTHRAETYMRNRESGKEYCWLQRHGEGRGWLSTAGHLAASRGGRPFQDHHLPGIR